MNGLFVTLEGIEGSGKSTQIKLLKSALKKRAVVVTREPGGTPISDKIRKILLSKKNRRMVPLCELLLYEASRAQHVEELVRPALKKGKVVISDRFYDATSAYQGIVRGIPRKWVEKLNLFATSGLKPGLTIVLDCPVQKGFARLKGRKKNLDRLEREKRSFHERVRKAYLLLASLEPRRIKVIDGNREPDKVHRDILKLVHKK